MSLRLAALRTPLRAYRPTAIRAYTVIGSGGAPGTGQWSTATDPTATESEADVRADQSAPEKPSAALQDLTAKEAEAEFRTQQPVVDKIKGAAKRAVDGVKEVLK